MRFIIPVGLYGGCERDLHVVLRNDIPKNYNDLKRELYNIIFTPKFEYRNRLKTRRDNETLLQCVPRSQ